MNKSKKLIFSFFIAAAIMNSKNMLCHSVHASDLAPNPQSSAYTSNANIFTKYGYKGQCTWFTYGRTLEKLGISLPSEFYGNAVDWWFANEKDHVYAYGSEPKPNSIAVWGGGNLGYGHVAFVENVEGNTVYFNEGNFSVRKDYDGKLKSLSKEEFKNRGNLHLEGYIYLNEKSSSANTDKNTNAASSSSSESSLSKGIITLSNKNSTLNVRDKSSTSSTVIGSLKNGDSVSILESYNGWYKIKFNSSYGYISSKYVSTSTNTSSNTIIAAPIINNSSSLKLGVVSLNDNSSTLRFRSTPGGQVINSLVNGTKVNILNLENGWYKINLNGTIGYVSSSYVSVSQPQTTNVEPTASQTGKIGVVTLSDTSSTLNLRNTPWTGRVISVLPYGSKVDILATSGRWYKVKSGSDVGYVHSDYIKV
ncbi:SH3 domain-containing protein [Clostridium sp. PL3]|uniref:SH3 domain-containing protein n=1 Tax=Clostridium thailandense TaxID=2794346 RepID=A0A949X3G3_9CLOT|nr:SH3 domain-containing protein [Clostridium thailandense]MBV7274534.1 SH3 domain-containing protein [Clostridium thailandense]